MPSAKGDDLSCGVVVCVDRVVVAVVVVVTIGGVSVATDNEIKMRVNIFAMGAQERLTVSHQNNIEQRGGGRQVGGY